MKAPEHPFEAVGQCEWCHGTKPGRWGFRTYEGKQYHCQRRECWVCPLKLAFGAACIPYDTGMNFLQDQGLIADECVHSIDIPPATMEVILARFEKKLNPVWLQLCLFSYLEKIEERACAMQAVA